MSGMERLCIVEGGGQRVGEGEGAEEGIKREELEEEEESGEEEGEDKGLKIKEQEGEEGKGLKIKEHKEEDDDSDNVEMEEEEEARLEAYDFQFSEEEDDDSVEDGGEQEQRLPQYQVLTPDQISAKMFQCIEEVNSILQLPGTHVRLLLSICSWDKDWLLNRYYGEDREELLKEACLTFPQAQTRVTESPTDQSLEYLCDICLLAYPVSEMKGLECGHLFCKECWDHYLRVSIMCEGQGKTIQCPASDCYIVVDEATVLSLVIQDSVRQRYQILIISSFVADHPKLKWCPCQSCPNALIVIHANRADQAVTCTCGHAFCFECGREPHAPILCKHLRRWLSRYDEDISDRRSIKWISTNTKECPRCHVAIEKRGGCNHMTCSLCKQGFCWNCQRVKTHAMRCDDCYKPADGVQGRVSTGMVAQATLPATMGNKLEDKYQRNLDRYIVYHNYTCSESKLYQVAHLKMEEIMTRQKVPWIEAQFLVHALDVLSKCRRTLMYMYAFTYFLRKNIHTDLLEFNQQRLEDQTQSLTDCLDLEGSFTRTSLTLARTIVPYCEAQRQVVLRVAQEGYDQDFWNYTE